jgi:hypothetical protein
MVTSLRQLLALLCLLAAAAPVTAAQPGAERILAEAGFWGSRLVVEHLVTDRLPYADNFVELIADGWTIARKPALEGADDWPHWAHGPDNNPVSADSVIRPRRQ